MEMRKAFYIMFTILIGLFSPRSMALKINYYTLIKIVDYGKESTKCNGGQFVKVSKNVCYDVDAKGNDVGNGKLYRDVSGGSNDNVYVGDSYHGKSRYLFNSDYSTLTIEINPHYKYIYKKTVAPSGIYTCSLIKKQNNGTSNPPINVYDNNMYVNSGYIQGGNGQSLNSTSNSSSSTTQPARLFKCAYCNGTGRIERNDNAPASFGQSKANKKCNECGKIYDPTVFNHYHVQCGHCGGTGNAK